jgi:hypothetical protein
MTTIEQFAETHRLRVRRDECDDRIIQGRRGHLYFDGQELCLMAIDRRPALRSRWETLGGKLWMGDISPNANGTRVQDVKVTGITNPKAAITMAGVKTIRVMSGAQIAALGKARALLPGNSLNTFRNDIPTA